MLTGKFLPTRGTAFLNGLSITKEQRRIRSQLGYCPQHDALLDKLTVTEHLQLFARLKGARSTGASTVASVCSPNTGLREVVAAVVRAMDLGSAIHKCAGQLSGGNKRKLSVGMATIGRPPLIFLDEVSWSVKQQASKCICP